MQKSMTHAHESEHTSVTQSGTVWEVCDCGASRSYKNGKLPGPWHTCALCTHAYGLAS